MRDHKTYVDILRVLGESLDRHILEDSRFSAEIPAGAHIAIQLQVPVGTPPAVLQEVERFNRWAMDLALRQKDPDAPLLIALCRLRPLMAMAADRLTAAVIEQVRGDYALQLAA